MAASTSGFGFRQVSEKYGSPQRQSPQRYQRGTPERRLAGETTLSQANTQRIRTLALINVHGPRPEELPQN